MDKKHMVACFLRVDLQVQGEPDEDLYESISERLQDIVMESSAGTGQADLALRGSTCRVLGPLEPADEIANNYEPGSEFDILLEHLDSERDEEDDD